MGFYLFHIIKNDTASEIIRVVLGIGVFMLPYIAMPVSYYLYIWQEEPPDWALAKEPKAKTTTTSEYVISGASKQTGTSKKTLMIIWGIVGVIVLIFLIFVFVRFITNFNRTMQESIFAEPTPVIYESLPTYPADKKPLYRPVELSSFTHVNSFKDISTWDDYNEIPILILDDTVFIAGNIQKREDDWSINVDLLSADINTGHVNWQAQTGSSFLLKDEKHIFAEAISDYGPAGMAAYDINTGELDWETRFDYEYAAGIGHVALTETDLTVETYHHGKDAFYILDKETGEIKEVRKDTGRYGVDEALTYNDIVLEKQGYGIPDPIIARNRNDGSIVWRFDDPVVSNIAVGGPITYFLTKDVKLIALDTETGEVLGTLSFAPGFSHDFDFTNTSLIVAADKDIVAVYFEDSKQLSIFRFNETAQ
jgi:hypothetical protein